MVKIGILNASKTQVLPTLHFFGKCLNIPRINCSGIEHNTKKHGGYVMPKSKKIVKLTEKQYNEYITRLKNEALNSDREKSLKRQSPASPDGQNNNRNN